MGHRRGVDLFGTPEEVAAELGRAPRIERLAPMFERLAADLESGAWNERDGHLRDLDSYEGSLRLIISEPARA